MTTQEFKEKYPHLAHLEGNDLWDAMERSMIKPHVPKPGDDEIIKTIESQGFTFNFTKGAVAAMKEFEAPEGNYFSNFGIIMPQQSVYPQHDPSGAHFSNDRKYRYALWRVWDNKKPLILFIGLNPSTADETKDDATIRKVIKFAKRWKYGGIVMMNLFAFISPYPKDLKTCNDPVGENDWWLHEYKMKCRDVLFAWGNFPEAKERAEKVAAMFDHAVCLGLNNNGTPKHPLYIKDRTHQINFK